MDIEKILSDDDAVSPVIGVILMVAITVILAAVIASFVLGLGDQAQQTTPQASFNFNYDQSGTNDVLTITHEGGDTIDNSRVMVKSDTDFRAGLDNSSSSSSGTQHKELAIDSSWTVSGSSTTWVGNDLSAGSSFDIVGDGVSLNGATVRIVYEAQSGDSSSTLATWEGPDA